MIADIHNVDKRITYFNREFYWSVRRLESSGFQHICFQCFNGHKTECMKKNCQCECRAAEFEAVARIYYSLTGHSF